MTLVRDYLNQVDVWAEGRAIFGQMFDDYCRRFPGDRSTPPAIAIRDVLPEVLDAKVTFDPLSLNVYDRTRWQGGRFRVTVNALIRMMPDVLDVEGVENVCLCHEAIHIVRDADLLTQAQPLPFAGFETSSAITCYRADKPLTPDVVLRRREFRAEEAGRAAAVSIPHLLREQSFLDLIDAGRRRPVRGRAGWSLLYSAAKAIGVNRSAATKQLQLEGWIAIEPSRDGDKQILVQPGLITLAEARP